MVTAIHKPTLDNAIAALTAKVSKGETCLTVFDGHYGARNGIGKTGWLDTTLSREHSKAAVMAALKKLNIVGYVHDEDDTGFCVWFNKEARA